MKVSAKKMQNGRRKRGHSATHEEKAISRNVFVNPIAKKRVELAAIDHLLVCFRRDSGGGFVPSFLCRLCAFCSDVLRAACRGSILGLQIA
jgi:hypothetical protein